MLFIYLVGNGQGNNLSGGNFSDPGN